MGVEGGGGGAEGEDAPVVMLVGAYWAWLVGGGWEIGYVWVGGGGGLTLVEAAG